MNPDKATRAFLFIEPNVFIFCFPFLFCLREYSFVMCYLFFNVSLKELAMFA